MATNTQKAIKGLSSQAIVTISSGIVEILYFSIMSRLLSREDFGIFAVVTAVTAIFLSLSDAGVGSALIQRKSLTTDYKNTAFTLSLILGIAIMVLMIGSSYHLSLLLGDEKLYIPLLVMSITIFFNSIISVNLSCMYRELHFILPGMIQLVSFLLSSIIAIILAIKGYGVYAILLKIVLSSFLTLIISFFYIPSQYRLCLNKECSKSILNFGGWLTASVIIHSISVQVDRLLMSRLLSLEALGAYNRPKEFVLQIGTRLNGIFDTALFPVLSSLQDNILSLQNAFKRSLYILNLASIILSLFFICNSYLIIRVFFGDNWLDLSLLFQIVSITLIFNVNGRLGDCYLRSMGLVKMQFKIRTFELFFDIICILIGASYGILGVAIGFLIANFTVILIKTLYLSGLLKVPFSELANIVICTWGVGIYFTPLLVIQTVLIQFGVWGDILSGLLFLIILFFLFVVFPSALGMRYKEELYTRGRVIINSFLNRMIKKSKRLD